MLLWINKPPEDPKSVGKDFEKPKISLCAVSWTTQIKPTHGPSSFSQVQNKPGNTKGQMSDALSETHDFQAPQDTALSSGALAMDVHQLQGRCRFLTFKKRSLQTAATKSRNCEHCQREWDERLYSSGDTPWTHWSFPGLPACCSLPKISAVKESMPKASKNQFSVAHFT